jgi:ABC-type multidrug transport system ATPase subunit
MMKSSPSTVSATADAIIRTARLTKVYAGTDFPAIDELSLTAAAGKIFGLLGPNGAGKTTTAGMLTTRHTHFGIGERRWRRRDRTWLPRRGVGRGSEPPPSG